MAAGNAATQWSADPAGALLLEASPGLWGHGPELETEARAQLTEWPRRLTKVVEERGRAGGRSRSRPPLGSTPSGWWPCWPCSPLGRPDRRRGGHRRGDGGLNQKLLEALIGEAAVADIIRAAERDLRRTLRSALESDARRFLDLLAPSGEGPEALRAAADRVLAEAERLIASLGGASSRG